jgi:hypothetical protein
LWSCARLIFACHARFTSPARNPRRNGDTLSEERWVNRVADGVNRTGVLATEDVRWCNKPRERGSSGACPYVPSVANADCVNPHAHLARTWIRTLYRAQLQNVWRAEGGHHFGLHGRCSCGHLGSHLLSRTSVKSSSWNKRLAPRPQPTGAPS